MPISGFVPSHRLTVLAVLGIILTPLVPAAWGQTPPAPSGQICRTPAEEAELARLQELEKRQQAALDQLTRVQAQDRKQLETLQKAFSPDDPKVKAMEAVVRDEAGKSFKLISDLSGTRIKIRALNAKAPCPPPVEETLPSPGLKAPFAEQPVPPLTGGPVPPHSTWDGPYVGLHVNLRFDEVLTREFWHGTDIQTNRLNDRGTNLSGGIEIGFDRRMADNGLVYGVRIDLSGGDDEVRRTFPGGAYIGSTIDFSATLQGRVGMVVQPNAMVYVQGGLAVANQTFKIDFGGLETNTSRFTVGGIIGVGGEWMLPGPSPLGFGRAMSIFGEYSHTWWDSARLNRPAASPSYDYIWARQTDAVRVGARVRF